MFWSLLVSWIQIFPDPILKKTNLSNLNLQNFNLLHFFVAFLIKRRVATATASPVYSQLKSEFSDTFRRGRRERTVQVPAVPFIVPVRSLKKYYDTGTV